MNLPTLPLLILHEIWKYLEPNHKIVLRSLCKRWKNHIILTRCNIFELIKHGNFSLLKYVNFYADYTDPKYFEAVCAQKPGKDKILCLEYLRMYRTEITYNCLSILKEQNDNDTLKWFQQHNYQFVKEVTYNDDLDNIDTRNDFDDPISLACKDGNIKLVKQLLSKWNKNEYNKLCDNSDLYMYDFDEGYPRKWFNRAISYGNVELVKYFINTLSDTGDIYVDNNNYKSCLLEVQAEQTYGSGDKYFRVDMLNLLFSLDRGYHIGCLIKYMNNNKKLFDWIESKLKLIKKWNCDTDCYIDALKSGSIESLQLLYSNGFKLRDDLFKNIERDCTINGETYYPNLKQTLSWLISKNVIISPYASLLVLYTGDLELCKWYKSLNYKFTYSAYSCVIIGCEMSVLDWFYEENQNILFGYIEDIINALIHRGSIKAFEWFRIRGCFDIITKFRIELPGYASDRIINYFRLHYPYIKISKSEILDYIPEMLNPID